MILQKFLTGLPQKANAVAKSFAGMTGETGKQKQTWT